jgi:type I restriction enzyme M protein
VIRAIVEMVDPQIGETIYDPAAGTAGFLVAAYNHIRLRSSSPDAIEEVELDGKLQRRGHGDRLSDAQFRSLQNQTFYGCDAEAVKRLATLTPDLECAPEAGQDQAAGLTVCRAWWSSNWAGLR